jgi:hypothetical protein
LLRERARSRAEDDTDRLAEGSRLREDSEGALLQLVVMVLEEDEGLHRSRLSRT